LQAGVVAKPEFRQQVTSTDTAGGFTVPTELQATLIKAMAAWGPMYDEDVGTTLNTATGAPIELPTVDDTASTAGAHTEGADLTDDGGKDVVLGKLILNAFMYDTEFIRFSMELARDSLLNFEQILSDLLGERLGRITNQMLTTGTGTGQPNGIVTASSLGITAAAGAAITSDELFDVQHEVDPAYRASPKVGWMFNDTSLKAIRKMKDGQGNYLWQMGDVKSGAPATLLDKPYRINQAMDDIAISKKPIIFGDLGKYYVRKVGAPVVGVLRERFWPNLGIAGLVAVDGELGDPKAVKHLKMGAA
jgi:HK97 family phage major capsid protein